MPVFTAFGWGEEQAVTFALSQLELFIGQLHANLPHDLRAQYPFFGLDRATQVVYLAAAEDVEADAHLFFRARPTAFIITLALTDKKALAKMLKRAEKDSEEMQQMVQRLGSEWELRIQQLEILLVL